VEETQVRWMFGCVEKSRCEGRARYLRTRTLPVRDLSLFLQRMVAGFWHSIATDSVIAATPGMPFEVQV
jgi:hypothetical protein